MSYEECEDYEIRVRARADITAQKRNGMSEKP